MKLLSTLILCLFSIIQIQAQSKKAIKQYDKVLPLIEKGEQEKAREKLEDIVKEYPTYAEAWDLLSKLHFSKYENASEESMIGDIFVTTTDSAGNKQEGSDSLVDALNELLSNMNPKAMAFDQLMFATRRATLHSKKVYMSDIILRMKGVDVIVDTNVSKKALDIFHQAEQQFQSKNYNKAAELYGKALEMEPEYYKAYLYLGDCYFALENYTESARVFKEISQKFPDQLEPKKYLADSYSKSGMYDKALEASIDAMTVYPDLVLKFKIEELAMVNGKKFSPAFMERPIFPNKMEVKDAPMNLADKPLINKDTPEHWKTYREALEKGKDLYNEQGILKAAGEAHPKHLEIYSWEYMLKNSDDPSLEQAKKMYKEGWLDCYVMITCFHYDFYEQYLDFAAKNPERIKKYFETYMVAN